MIEFLGNSVYEIDLSHIEAVEILQENYDHIHRFVKLIYEWTLFQTGNHQSIGKKHIDLCNSEFMPTVDTYGNINNGTQSKTDIIDFYNRARPELKIDCNPQGPSKFRILSSKQKCDSSEIKDIFKNTAGGVDISSRTQSLATSVNTTILGSNGNQKSVEDCKLLNPSIHEESSYERSLDKGIIRSQAEMLKKTNEVNKSNNINDSFDVIADIIKSNKRASLKNMRVKSFSPVSKTKDSFGLYYDQNHPDSAETRIKTKGMAYQQNENLSNYKINDNSKEGYSRNMVPIMSAHTLNFNNPGINIKGIMTASNFSNNEYKDFGAKGSNFLKSYTNQMKYKGKKSTEANNKSTAKYSTNYSSKRPKSAKGVGTYINTSKYRQNDNQASSIYKNSLSKGSISHKYTSSSKSKKHGNSSQLKKTQSIKSITTKTK